MMEAVRISETATGPWTKRKEIPNNYGKMQYVA
jgi:hypothetical protein